MATRNGRLTWVIVVDADRPAGRAVTAAAATGLLGDDYADYLARAKETAAEDVEHCAVGIVGPRNRVDKIVNELPLLP